MWDVEVSAWGVACMAGWGAGLYGNLAQIEALWAADKVEKPRMEEDVREGLYHGWRIAISRVRSTP